MSVQIFDEIADEAYKVDGHIKIDTNLTDQMIDGISVLKDIELQFSGEVDSKNSIANMTINTKYKSGKLLDLKLYLEKEDTIKELYVIKPKERVFEIEFRYSKEKECNQDIQFMLNKQMLNKYSILCTYSALFII